MNYVLLKIGSNKEYFLYTTIIQEGVYHTTNKSFVKANRKKFKKFEQTIMFGTGYVDVTMAEFPKFSIISGNAYKYSVQYIVIHDQSRTGFDHYFREVFNDIDQRGRQYFEED